MNEAKLAAARLWVVHADRYPYLASAVFALSAVAVPGLGTFGVDRRWRLYVDPDVLEHLSVAQVGSLLVHEVHHPLRDHASRADAMGVSSSNAHVWNAAADAEINDDLVDEKRLSLPGTPVVPAQLGCEDGGLAEQYFRVRPTVEVVVPACGSGADGISRPWDRPAGDHSTAEVDSGDAELIRTEVARAIIERHDTPPGWRRWAEQLLRSRVDWRRVLAAEVRRGLAWVAGTVDYDSSRQSRRQSVMGPVVLPALRRPVPEVAIVVDTSASMRDDDLAHARAEVERIMRSAGVTTRGVTVLACDARVHTAARVSSARQVVLEGGGGTDMGAGIDAALALRPRPQLVVVLTDGWTTWPAHPPARTTVVVGLIGDSLDPPPAPPAWARTVRIEAA